jgi:putative tRNA adenosine deaminase-associated protein
MLEGTAVDFVVVVFREDERWQVSALPPRTAEDLHSFTHALRQQPSEGVALGLCAFDDDFFLAVRPDGDDVRLMISDASAAADWPIAAQALELVGEPLPEDENAEQVRPAGDLSIFADIGMTAMELGGVCSDLELYPDEMLGQIAGRIGFGHQFDRAVETDPAQYGS